MIKPLTLTKLHQTRDWFKVIMPSLFFAYLAYFSVAQIYPVEITEFQHKMVVHGPVIAGQWATYNNHFTKKYDCYGEVSRQLTNGTTYTVPVDVVAVTSEKGEHDMNIPFYVPESAPTGDNYYIMFYYRWTLSRPLLPPRMIEKRINSEKFSIIGKRGMSPALSSSVIEQK